MAVVIPTRQQAVSVGTGEHRSQQQERSQGDDRPGEQAHPDTAETLDENEEYSQRRSPQEKRYHVPRDRNQEERRSEKDQEANDALLPDDHISGHDQSVPASVPWEIVDRSRSASAA